MHRQSNKKGQSLAWKQNDKASKDNAQRGVVYQTIMRTHTRQKMWKWWPEGRECKSVRPPNDTIKTTTKRLEMEMGRKRVRKCANDAEKTRGRRRRLDGRDAVVRTTTRDTVSLLPRGRHRLHNEVTSR